MAEGVMRQTTQLHNTLSLEHTPIEWKKIFESPDFAAKFHDQNVELGALYTKEETSFSIWAPTASAVSINLYKTGSDMEPQAELIRTMPMERAKKGIWNRRIEGDLSGIYYTYTVLANGTSEETADIYARACGVNGRRSMVIDLDATNPEGWEQDFCFGSRRNELAENPVIYELHIKDFSSDPHSGIQKSYRGKYMAFTEKNSTLDGNGDKETCLAYLKDLGITYVHLLPFFDYGSVDESGDLNVQFNWGYDPVNYNVPEGSYSTDPWHGEVRIRECKEMIKSLHDAGIAVVMDVVYNHTYHTESPFQYTVPYYYYRVDDSGQFANGSLCGNDTASERTMYRKFMIDSVRYWAEEYHIDGFRFDLMGLHDTETMNQIREALDELPYGKSILMYGEPWSGDHSPMARGSIPALKESIDRLDGRIAVFCDSTRDAVKGDVFIAEEPGFINGGTELEEDIENSVCAWCSNAAADFRPKSSAQVLTYVSAHDNFTLWDKLCYTDKQNENKKKAEIDFVSLSSRRLQQNKMAAGICFTCLGTPFFQAGEEFARTKLGIEDSFNASFTVNRLDWRRAWENEDLVRFYRGLIALRKELWNFYKKSAQDPARIRFENREEGIVSFRIKGRKGGAFKELFIIYNANPEKKMVNLPPGRWQMLCDGGQVLGTEKTQLLEEKQFIAKGCAVVITGKR